MINSFFGSICALERFILLELEFWPINLLDKGSANWK